MFTADCFTAKKNKDNEKVNYDVLDGQQRLTTLYLLLVYLKKKRNELDSLEEKEERKDYYSKPLFSLDYITRKECGKFLSEEIFTNSNVDRSNIDFYYICKAYHCIEEWFKDEKHDEKHREAESKLVKILLDETGKGRNVRVIRYEVEKETNPIEVFIRLNIGKIPLTDAELTKALLLQSDKYPQTENIYEMKLFNIATEWDNIETTLRDKPFWYFLNDNSNEKSSHIEFIFDLLADKINAERVYFEKKPKKHATFHIFSKYLKDLIGNGNDEKARIEAVKKIWGEIIEYFEYFKEWFHDRTLYHYIGLLIALKNNKIIDSIIQEEKQNSKPKFKEYLEKEIAKIVQAGKPIDKLVYEDEKLRKIDYKEIYNILLLHNVYTTLKSKNENPYFPFEIYKEQEWSLEHIFARNSKPLTGIKKQKEWLDDHIESLSHIKSDIYINELKSLIEKMEDLKTKEEIDNDYFAVIEGKAYEIQERCHELAGSDKKDQSIKNLCLLDKETNSHLSNSFFDVKRERIRKRELEGYYIPVCTRNVFLKAYTAYPDTNVYWKQTDKDCYLMDIEKTYNFFIDKLKE